MDRNISTRPKPDPPIWQACVQQSVFTTATFLFCLWASWVQYFCWSQLYSRRKITNLKWTSYQCGLGIEFKLACSLFQLNILNLSRTPRQWFKTRSYPVFATVILVGNRPLNRCVSWGVMRTPTKTSVQGVMTRLENKNNIEVIRLRSHEITTWLMQRVLPGTFRLHVREKNGLERVLPPVSYRRVFLREQKNSAFAPSRCNVTESWWNLSQNSHHSGKVEYGCILPDSFYLITFQTSLTKRQHRPWNWDTASIFKTWPCPKADKDTS